MKKLYLICFVFMAMINSIFADTQHISNKCLPKSDNQYRKLILGNWYSEEDFNSTNNHGYIIKQNFFINGDLILTFVDKSHPGKVIGTIKAKWEIKSGKLYEHALSASS